MTLLNTRNKLLRGLQNPPTRRKEVGLSNLWRSYGRIVKAGRWLLNQLDVRRDSLLGLWVHESSTLTQEDRRRQAESDVCSSPREVTGSEMEWGETNTYGLPHMGWAATFTMLSLTLQSGPHHLLCSHVFFHSLTEVSSLAQRHTASQWQSQYSNWFYSKAILFLMFRNRKIQDTEKNGGEPNKLFFIMLFSSNVRPR